MIFLLQYNKTQGRLVSLQRFHDHERAKAEEVRLRTELELNREGVNHEVVLLEAADDEALQKTHRRYFADVRELIRSCFLVYD